MTTINQAEFDTLHAAFVAIAEAHPENAFLVVPKREGRDYDPDGREITYGEALATVDDLIGLYRDAGYGMGHRVALLLENRPEHFLHLLAFSALGISLVSINPDYTHDEMLYQMEHSDAELAVVRTKRIADVEAVGEDRANEGAPLPVVDGDALPEKLPRAPRPPQNEAPGRHTELGLYYTSGTTGRPKGCVVTNHYFLVTGAGYLDALQTGDLTIEAGKERLYNPLPLYHVNACVISFGGMLQSANAQIQPDRFHPTTWWSELAQTRATIFHYLGVVPPMLLNQPESPDERNHAIKWGLGAGIEPALHAKFEQRFGLPLYEGWGMTETGRVFAASGEPRHIDTRAFGRPNKWMTGKIVDEHDKELPRGTPGELVVWTPGEDPRDGFFSGYLKNEAATEESWRNGFFHTGDTVIQREDDMFIFVDRSKNIIRRSGENIAAAEIEACLAADERVANIAVLAVPDELREEEVMACIVAKGAEPGEALADELMDLALEKLSYFKAPGWWLFVDKLPTTGTQKVQKQQIFAKGADPREQPGVIDRRDRKKRPKR